MSSPTPVRLPDDLKKSLQKVQRDTGLKQADVIRLAVEEILKKYPTDSEMVQAIILHRTAEARKNAGISPAAEPVVSTSKKKPARARQ